MEDNAGNAHNFMAGDIHFIDQDRDGKITESDKTVIGDPNPDIYGNIFANVSWKNLTLSIGFNYSLGNDVYNYQRMILNSGSNFYNQQISEVATKASRPRCRVCRMAIPWATTASATAGLRMAATCA